MKTRNYKMDLALMAYPNELTPDIDTDYIVKVNTQSQSLTLEDMAADVAARSGKIRGIGGEKPFRDGLRGHGASGGERLLCLHPSLLRAPDGEWRGDGRRTLPSGRQGKSESLREFQSGAGHEGGDGTGAHHPFSPSPP